MTSQSYCYDEWKVDVNSLLTYKKNNEMLTYYYDDDIEYNMF